MLQLLWCLLFMKNTRMRMAFFTWLTVERIPLDPSRNSLRQPLCKYLLFSLSFMLWISSFLLMDLDFVNAHLNSQLIAFSKIFYSMDENCIEALFSTKICSRVPIKLFWFLVSQLFFTSKFEISNMILAKQKQRF